MSESSEKKYPSDRADRFNVRMPEGMHEKLRLASEKSGRSMNAEIVHRLEQSFQSEHPLPAIDEEAANRLKEIVMTSFLEVVDQYKAGGLLPDVVLKEEKGGQKPAVLRRRVNVRKKADQA